MLNRINFSRIFAASGNVLSKIFKIILLAGGFLFIVIWKIVGYFLGMAGGMADYMAFGKRNKRGGW